MTPDRTGKRHHFEITLKKPAYAVRFSCFKNPLSQVGFRSNAFEVPQARGQVSRAAI